MSSYEMHHNHAKYIIFSIILITTSIKFTILSSVCLKSSNDHRLNSNGTHVKWTHKIRLPEIG